tara:strand:+ start:5301 stop:5924 length:624 start_codon:yes stop_codon:yes gene_type:complete
MGSPINLTSPSREAKESAAGQGCPDEQDPSISRAAMPARRIRGPSAHQIGPSPSQTAVGVHSKTVPDGTDTADTKAKRSSDIMEEISTGRTGSNEVRQDDLSGPCDTPDFKMEWIANHAAAPTLECALVNSRDQMIDLLDHHNATLFAISLMDGDRVAASVLTSAADIVKWEPDTSALPRPIVCLPSSSVIRMPLITVTKVGDACCD